MGNVEQSGRLHHTTYTCLNKDKGQSCCHEIASDRMCCSADDDQQTISALESSQHVMNTETTSRKQLLARALRWRCMTPVELQC